MNFYLEAKKWPADFIFEHAGKVAAFGKIGCPQQLLPHRGGQPYLWEDFVLDVRDGGLCVAIVDRPHWSALLQLLSFVKRFALCCSRVGGRLSLTVAVGSEARRRLYERAARHRRVVEYSNGKTETYQVSRPIPHIRTMTHEPVIHSNFESRRP